MPLFNGLGIGIVYINQNGVTYTNQNINLVITRMQIADYFDN